MKNMKKFNIHTYMYAYNLCGKHGEKKNININFECTLM